MPTYIAHIDVAESEFQNPQEFVSIWGSIREDVQEQGGDLLETYAVLGDYDFDVRFEADDEEVAFRISQVIERHGFDTKTLQAISIDRLGALVEDI